MIGESMPMGTIPADRMVNGPVCVDLDGTLIVGDLMWESFVGLFRRRPWTALSVAVSVVRGRANFKRRVAENVEIDAATLAYRRELLEELQALHRQGIPLLLVTAAHDSYAKAVSSYLGIFQDVIASDGRRNVRGADKAALLVQRFGERGFDYIGNDWCDLPVWRKAARPTVVAGPPALVRQLTREQRNVRVMTSRRGTFAALLAALRPHQWAKNALVFVPIVAAHTLLRAEALFASFLTFVTFSLCASAIYILNDISDVDVDRQHARKRRRPFASGELGVPAGCLAAAGLFVGAFVLAVIGVSWQLAMVLGAYVIVTSAYTLRLKRLAVADVFTLTGLYVLRIIAGGVATGTRLTTWLLAFALFFFLGLAFVKRYIEVIGTQGQLPGREYGPDDAMWMHAIGTSSGYMAVVVLALYVTMPEVTRLYARPDVLWLLCPLLLFWLTRLWFRAGRRLLHDDPVVDAWRDPIGYVIFAAAAAILLVASV
jgi:4-hydroxybenzoate polyprenyltransferase